jgi:hypothetical protein
MTNDGLRPDARNDITPVESDRVQRFLCDASVNCCRKANALIEYGLVPFQTIGPEIRHRVGGMVVSRRWCLGVDTILGGGERDGGVRGAWRQPQWFMKGCSIQDHEKQPRIPRRYALSG